MHRFNRVVDHVNNVDRKRVQAQTTSSSSSSREPPLPTKWNGWGFQDTQFYLNDEGAVALNGKRYLFSGKTLPSLRPWLEEKAGLDVNDVSAAQEVCEVDPSVRNETFLSAVEGKYKYISFDDQQRLFHSHGHTSQEIWMLRYGKVPRVVDVVIWPSSHEDVEAIVAAAVQHDVAIIPYGGGTSVSQALLCPENEKRMIVSLDMHEMNQIKWIDRKSMLACVQAGAIGKKLEAELNAVGLCTGHEPDSSEFSTLGGWIATRASGMRKNKYGNIEEIVRQIRMVTAKGTIQKNVRVPRMSTGPDVHEIMLGSEGTYGVITEAVIRLCEKPPIVRYGSMIFPDFESGVACMYEVAMRKCAPVSIRLVDNLQFQFGQSLKPEVTNMYKHLMDKAKKWYVLNRLHFDPDRMTAATLLFEGTAEEVAKQERQIYSIAKKHGGMKAGEENGIRGYFLTYMIAYLRDFGYNYSFMAESFETSVPWDKVLELCSTVKARIEQVAQDEKIRGKPFVSCRVTQTYDTGACVYFYFGFIWTGLPDPIATFGRVEHAARDEIMRLGGSLSHHHGVGKIRKHWMEETVSSTGIELLRGIKKAIDPTNVFASDNLV